MAPLKALLWDVDGTLAETERDGHRVAFNQAFEACGLPWRWDVARYGQLLHITGGRERLLHDMQTHADAPVRAVEREALALTLHAKKNLHYADIVASGLIPLRPGVMALMEQCWARGVRTALATTTSRPNVNALMRWHFGAAWAEHFAAVVCGEDVLHKKPDPAVYLLALQQLGISPGEAVALEDSPPGVAAARAAGVPVVVTRSVYFEQAVFASALAIGPGLHKRQGWHPALVTGGATPLGVGLDDIQAWLAVTG